MKFLLLIYRNPASQDVWDAMSDAERTHAVGGYVALNNDLEAAGASIAHESLADADQTRSVSVRDGRTLTTDGPFAEVKEHLAGFYVIDCASVDQAIGYAARIPEAQIGTIEVRPVRDLGQYGL
ncbi:MAG TPA: YciI family protein [Mycobacteriales bacterium]|nr:YciI family protein [Mycobacteriales bacterium]